MNLFMTVKRHLCSESEMSSHLAPCIALLGAESTGKSTLAEQLTAGLNAQGIRTVSVPEVLRHWCEAQGRTPKQEEQAAIAQTQSAAIAEARRTPGVQWVIADTTALMTAVYSDLLFNDRSLYPEALEALREDTLIALTALDLPWVADGLQRDGAHVREPVDARVRQALTQAGLPFHVIHGQGAGRCHHGLHLVLSRMRGQTQSSGSAPPASPEDSPARWHCPWCADPDSELRLFRQLREKAKPSHS